MSVPTETVENRVLLSSTNDVPEDLADNAQSTYIDPYESEIDQEVATSTTEASTYIGEPDLDAATTNSPVSEYFDPFSAAFEQGADEAAESQDESSSTADQQADSSGESEQAADTTSEDDAATDEAFSIFSGEADVAGYASGMLGESASGMMGTEPDGSGDSTSESEVLSGQDDSNEDNNTDTDTDNSDGSGENSHDDDSDESDDTTEPQLVSQWTPLQFPEHVVFDETTLTNADADLDWTAIQPAGTDSFSNTSTSDSTVDPSPDNNPDDPLAGAIANLGTTVTTSQTYVSPTEWEVTQAYTNKFDTSAPVANSQGETDGPEDESSDGDNGSSNEVTDTGDLNRTGTETLTVTIVDGVSRTISYVMTDTITHESGTFPDEAENLTDEEKWGIPDDWVTAAKTSVVPEDKDASEEDSEDQSQAGASGFDSWDSGTPVADGDADQEPVALSDASSNGSRYKATSTSGFTITETVTTLPDGSPGMTFSVMFHSSSSVTSKVQGSLDLGFGLGTISENQHDGNGFKVTANANWMFFSTASMNTSFGASATVAQDSGLAGLLNASISGSFGFDVSFQAGGKVGGELGFQYQTSAGDSSDGSDSYESFGIGGSAKATGYADFSFGVNLPFGASPETTTVDGEEVTQYAFEPADESHDDFKVQLSTSANGSGTVGGHMNYGSKSPDTMSDGYVGTASSSYSMETESSSGREFALHLGTEKAGFLVGASGSYSYTEKSNSSGTDAWDEGSNYLPRFESNVITTDLEQEQNYKFRVSVGLDDETTDEDSQDQSGGGSTDDNQAEENGNVNEGGASFDYTRIHTFFLDITSASGTYVDKTTIVGAIGDKAAGSQPTSDGDDNNDDDSDDGEETEGSSGGLVKNQTLTGSGMMGDHVTVLVDNEQLPWGGDPDGPERSKEEILQEYRDRATNISRWEAARDAALAEGDQQLADQYQSMIDDETSTLASVAAAALAAGATQRELDTIRAEAAAAAASDPIDLQGTGLVEWLIDTHVDVFDIGGHFIVGSLQGGAAAIDGIIPFYDPLEDIAYDGADPTLQWSQFSGGIARDAILIAFIPNISQWVKNPVMYELGSTTLPYRLFSSLAHLSPIQKGQAIYRQVGLMRGFGLGRFAGAADWSATVVNWSGLTPGGNLLLIFGLHGADWWVDE